MEVFSKDVQITLDEDRALEAALSLWVRNKSLERWY